jgi:hypothetical protein
MSVRTYLPSAQFFVIVCSLAVSGGVVWAAQYYVTKHDAPAQLASAADTSADQAWEQSLQDIQAQSGVSLPDAPSQDAVQSLLTQAQSDNLTDSVGRTLLVKLTAAGVQGLGDDLPTQNSIIADASAQINASPTAPKVPTLNIVDADDTTLRTYGNAFMQVLANHPKASAETTLVTIAKATDVQDPAPLAALAPIGQEYKAVADELTDLPVPKTLAPLHVQVVEDLYTVAGTYPDLAKVISDPLKGVTALQKYESTMGEVGRLLTNMADALNKGGILFSKDEPGSAWSTFSAP